MRQKMHKQIMKIIKEKLKDLSKKSSPFYEIVKQILRHLSDLGLGEAYFHEII